MDNRQFEDLRRGDTVCLMGGDKVTYVVVEYVGKTVIASRVIIITNTQAWKRNKTNLFGENVFFYKISGLMEGEVIYNRISRRSWVITRVHSRYAIAVRTIESTPEEAGKWEVASAVTRL